MKVCTVLRTLKTKKFHTASTGCFGWTKLKSVCVADSNGLQMLKMQDSHSGAVCGSARFPLGRNLGLLVDQMTALCKVSQTAVGSAIQVIVSMMEEADDFIMYLCAHTNAKGLY